MADRILIVGASARAAAASARRAGFVPFAVDLFADRDTQLLCERVWRCPPDEYPAGLFRLADQAPPMPWMYTGGLENYPKLIDAIGKTRPLLGNGSRPLRSVRDPFRLHAILTANGIATPPVCPDGPPAPDGDVWLRKRFRGSGGQGVTRYEYDPIGPKGGYLQRFVSGEAMSAVFAAMPWRVYPLAVTRQLVGVPWLHASGFMYCGNVGPVAVSPDCGPAITEIGRVTTQYGVKFGLYGVDLVKNDNEYYVIEVNPRYPASAEVIEHACGGPLFRTHVCCSRAMDDTMPDDEWVEPGCPPVRTIVGKAVYYAPHRLTFPASGPWDESLRRAADVWVRPDFADIPHPGDVIEPGHPVLTILADADTEAACLARLRTRAAELDRLFGHTPTPELE